MPSLTSEEYIQSHLNIGSVFLITAPELINTDLPHYFIVVAYDSEEVHFVECTTNRARLEDLFESKGFDFSGLIHMPPNRGNGLPQNSYVNCNDNYTISIDSLVEKRESNDLRWIGEISYNHYDQIRYGINDSNINDLPKSFLIHPND